MQQQFNPNYVKAVSLEQTRATGTDLKQADKVLLAFRKLGGKATDEQLSEATGIPKHIISARRNELFSKRYVRGTNETVVERYGRINTIWALTTAGMNEIINIMQPGLGFK